jgi:hypothetical protein
MGVALPQTGPDGILMSFSVEYEAPPSNTSPSLASKTNPPDYFWVIERAHGAPFKRAVRLSGQNTLAVLINEWRPTDAPFQTHIEDRYGHRLSLSIDLEGPGLPPN